MALNVDIVTAERVVYSEEGVDEVVVPGVEGELGVLTLHAPLLTMIQPGVMRIIKGGEEVEMAITGGFIEVRENRVTILADAAERAEEIDVVRAEEARRRARRLLEEREAEVDLARAEAALARALARIRAAERRRRRRGGVPAGPPGP
jgi:F-type H+-transporting ATPase subunit epsilon